MRNRLASCLASLSILGTLLSVPVASADTNPATIAMDSVCSVNRPTTTGNISGVPAVGIGEALTAHSRTTFGAGTVYQDVIERPDGTTYFSTYLQIVVPTNELTSSAGAPQLEIDGVPQLLTPGTEPTLGQWTLATVATATETTHSVFFPADAAALLASPTGAGVASYVVPSGGNTFDLSVAVSVPNHPALVEGTVRTVASCFSSASTGPSNRDTGVQTVKVGVIEPLLTVRKTASQAAVAPGEPFSYEIEVAAPTDSGTANELPAGTAHDVIVSDVLAPELTPLGADGSPLVDGAVSESGGTWNAATRTMRWTLPALAAGGSETLALRVRVSASTPKGTTVSNSVSATGTSLPGTVAGERTLSPVTSTATVAVGVDTPVIAKSASDPVIGWGAEEEFTVTATFPANSAYANALITDLLPDGFTFSDPSGYISATCTSGCAVGDPGPLPLAASPNNNGTTRIGWYLGSLSSSGLDRVYTVVYRATVDATYNDGSPIPLNAVLTNQAEGRTNAVDRLGQALPNLSRLTPFDATSSATTSVTIGRPVLSIAKSANRNAAWDPDLLDPTVTWTIDVTNTGNAPAFGVEVRDQGIGKTFGPGLGSYGLGLPTSISNGVTFTALGFWWHDVFTIPGSIAPGATMTFTFVTSSLPAFNAGYSRDVDLINTAQISKYRSGPTGTVYPATGESLPTSAAQVNATYPTPTLDKRIVTSQVASPPEFGVNGDTVTYELEIGNTGSGPLFNPSITETLPSGFTYVADSGRIVSASGGVRITDPAAPAVATISAASPYLLPGSTMAAELLNGMKTAPNAGFMIPPGEVVTVRFEVLTSANPGVWTNTARVNAVDGLGRAGIEDTPGDLTSRRLYQATDIIDLRTQRAALALTKTPDLADNVTVAQGGGGTYTIRVTNTSSVPALNVALTDTIGASHVYSRQAVATAGFKDLSNPGGLWSVSPDPVSAGGTRPTLTETPAGAPAPITNPVWTISRLEPGSTATVLVPITQSGALPADLTLTNTVSVNFAGNTSGALTDTGTMTIIPTAFVPDVTKLVERVDGLPMPAGVGGAPGTQMRYTITYTIHEQSVAVFDNTLVDTIPNGMTFDSVDSVNCSSAVPAYCATPLTTLVPVAMPNGTTRVGWFAGDRPVVGSPSVPGNDVTYTIVYRATIASSFGGNGTSPMGIEPASLVQAGRANGDPLVNRVTSYWRGANSFTAPATLPDLSNNLGTSGVAAQFTNRGKVATAPVKIYTPHLNVTKTADKTRVDPGTTVTYTVTIENTGTDTAHAALITDQPADNRLSNLTQTSLTGGVGTAAALVPSGPGQRWDITIGSLAAGAVVTFTYTARVPVSADLIPMSAVDARDAEQVWNFAEAMTYHSTPGGSGPGDQTYAGNSPSAVGVEVDTPLLSTTIGPAVGGVAVLASLGATARIRAYYDNTAYPNPNDRTSRVLSPRPAPNSAVAGTYGSPPSSTAGTSYNNIITVTLNAGTEFVPGSARVAGAARGVAIPAAATAFTTTFPDPVITVGVGGAQTLTWDLDTITSLPNRSLALTEQYSAGLAIEFTQRSTQNAPLRACGSTRITGQDGSGSPSRGTASGWDETYAAANGYCSPAPQVRKSPDIGATTDIGVQKPGETFPWSIRFSTPGPSGTLGTLSYDAGVTVPNPIWTDTLPIGLIYAPNSATFTDGTTALSAGSGGVSESITPLPDGRTRIVWTGLPTHNPGITWTGTVPVTVSPTYVFNSTEKAQANNLIAITSATVPTMTNGTCNSGQAGYCDSGSVALISNTVPAVTKSVNTTEATFGDVLTYTLNVTIPANKSYTNLVLDDYVPAAFNTNINTFTNGTFTCASGCGGPSTIAAAPMANWNAIDALGRHIGWLIGDGNGDTIIDGTVNAAPTARTLTFTYTVALKDATIAAAAAYAGPNTAQLFSYVGSGTGPIATVGVPATNWATNLTTTAEFVGYGTSTVVVNVAPPVLSTSKLCEDLNNSYPPRSQGATNLAALGYSNPAVATTGAANLRCQLTVTNTGTVPAYGVTFRDTPSTSQHSNAVFGSGAAITAQTVWNPLAIASTGSPATLSTDWATSGNSYLEWTTDPLDPIDPGESINISVDFNVDGWAYDRDPASTSAFRTGQNALVLGRVGYKPSGTPCPITAGAYVAPCIGANQTAVQNLVFERSAIAVGKQVVRELTNWAPAKEYYDIASTVGAAPYLPYSGVYSALRTDRQVPPLLPTPTLSTFYSGVGLNQTPALPNDGPIPPGVAVPAGYPNTYWVLDVATQDLANLDTLTVTESLPYGFRYVPGSLQAVNYTWNGTVGQNTFTPIPDAAAGTTVTPFGSPVDCAAGPTTVQDNGDTVRWNFNRSTPGEASIPWNSASSIWDASDPGQVPLTGTNNRLYTHVTRFVFATRHEVATSECVEAQRAAPSQQIVFINKAAAAMTHRDGVDRTATASRSTAMIHAMQVAKSPDGGVLGAGGTKNFDITVQFNALATANTTLDGLVATETVADYDPATGTNLYQLGTASAHVVYGGASATGQCPTSSPSSSHFPAEESDLLRDPTNGCQVVRDPYDIQETVVSRGPGGTVLQWRFPQMEQVTSRDGFPGKYNLLGACKETPLFDGDGAPSTWSDGSPRPATGNGCFEELHITMPITAPVGVQNGLTVTNDVQFTTDFLVIDNQDLYRDNAYPSNDSYWWGGIWHAGDTASLQIVSGDPAPTPVKSGPTTAQPGELVTWTVDVPIAAGDNYFDLRVLDTIPAEVDPVSVGALVCTDTAGTCTRARKTAPAVAPTAFTTVTNPDQTSTVGYWIGDLDAANEARTLTFTVTGRVRNAVGAREIVAGDVITNRVITQSELADVNPAQSLTTVPVGTPQFVSPAATAAVVVAEPKVELTKALTTVNAAPYSGAPLVAGDLIGYTITVSNSGTAPALDIAVTDTPDLAVSNVTATGTGVSQLVKGWTAADPVVRWFVPSVAAGASVQLTYEATVDASYLNRGMSTTVNTATAGPYRGLADTIPTGRTYDMVETSVEVALRSPKIEVDKFSNATCTPGSATVRPTAAQPWCIRVTNSGTDIAHAAQLVDQLPIDWHMTTSATPIDTIAVVPATVDGIPTPPSLTTSASSNEVLTWGLGDLAIDQTVEIRYFARSTVGAPLAATNRARVSITLSDGSAAPSTAIAFADRDLAAVNLSQFDLEISKTPDLQRLDLLPAGGPINWTVTVTNPGTDPLSGLRIVDSLPAGLTYTGGSATSTCAGFTEHSVGAGAAGSTEIQWRLSTLGSGASCAISITGVLPTGSGVATRDYVNHVEATSTEIVTPVENTARAHVFAAGSIGDRIWLDTDGDGIQDAGEPSIGDVDVVVHWFGLDGIAGNSDDQDFPTTTDSSGNYLVTGLEPGTYIVTVDTADLPAGITANTGDPDGGANATAQLVLSPDEDRRDQDFGFRGVGRIGDRVWYDRDGDGVQASTGEPGVAGATLVLVWAGPDQILGNSDDRSFTTVTDSAGNYLFDGLPDGVFSVTQTTPIPGSSQTFDPDSVRDGHSELTLSTGNRVNLDQDFGYRPSGSIGDRIWSDLDGDGIQDSDEPGIVGIDVTLIWFGADGVAGGGDDMTLTTTTNADGLYLFSNLPAGSYSITVTTPPTGFRQTGDPDSARDLSSTVSLPAGGSNLAQDFGFQQLASVGDFVWLDLNKDGVQDPSEVGLAGLSVVLVGAGSDGVFGTADDVNRSTTTSSTGAYLFDALVPGQYRITVTPCAGCSQTFDPDTTRDNQSSFALAAGEANRVQDFGYVGSSGLEGTVWVDSNGNGVIDAGEPRIPNLTVTVVDGAGVVIATLVTNEKGEYSIAGLPAGKYTVRLDLDDPDFPQKHRNVFDPDGDNDSSTTAILGVNEYKRNLDFGFLTGVSSRSLAFTGSSIVLLVGFALALLGIGFALLRGRRRRE